MNIFLFILSCLCVLAMGLPLFQGDAWWIRIFDFPRVQLAVLSFVVLLGHLAFWKSLVVSNHVLAFLLLLGIFYQGYRIFPYTPVATKQVLPTIQSATADSLSLMIANVLMTNRNAEGFLTLVREQDPDILIAVETDAWWEHALRGLEADYPYQVKHPLDNTYGMLVYARMELRDARVRFLIEDDVPSIWASVMLPSGTLVDLICLHPRPPRPDKAQDSTERDAEILLTAKEVAARERPVIVTGDLNDVAWSHTTRLFQRISGLLDPRRGRGLFSTFHAHYPFWRYPLDHVFLSPHFRLITLKRLDGFGSDHFPIYAALQYEPEGQERQEAPQPENDDLQEAEEKIRKPAQP